MEAIFSPHGDLAIQAAFPIFAGWNFNTQLIWSASKAALQAAMS